MLMMPALLCPTDKANGEMWRNGGIDIDIVASIVRLNQLEHSISTNESAPLCQGGNHLAEPILCRYFPKMGVETICRRKAEAKTRPLLVTDIPWSSASLV